MNDFNILEYSDGCKFIDGLPVTHETNRKLAYIHDIQFAVKEISFFEEMLKTETNELRIEKIQSIIQLSKDLINKLKQKTC